VNSPEDFAAGFMLGMLLFMLIACALIRSFEKTAAGYRKEISELRRHLHQQSADDKGDAA
jgi:hypothetical protein